MSTLLRIFSAVVLLLAAATAMAVEIENRIPLLTTPIEIQSDLGKAHPWGGYVRPAASVPIYSALDGGTFFVPTNAISPVDGLPYGEYADDLHMIGGGLVTGFAIGYFEPAAPTVDVLITLYGNDPLDSTLGAVVAGPFLYTGLPGGFNVVNLTVPPNTILFAQDVWFAVQFTPDTAGLVNAPAPSPNVGTSDDIFLDTTPPGVGLVFFGGPPDLANFMIEVQSDDRTVAVEEVTWSQVKSLYEN